MTRGSPAPPRRRAQRVLAWVFGSLGGLILAVVIGFLLWANTGVLAAEPGPLAEVRNDPALVLTDEGGAWVLRPSSGASELGLVFIPGAKIDAAAYAATFADVAADGATVVITKPTLNLAFFDFRPFSEFTALAPGVDEWFVGGHSLGGVRACQLAPVTAGLVLLGSYCANDLSGSGLAALSISASDDGLTTREDVEGSAPLLPPGAVFVEIEGGNHAGFGAYGPQAGDGEATIPSAWMHAEITAVLGPFLLGL